jgi:hypothetical protein
MDWTCGYVIASARDVSRFFWDLLGPEKKILSQESVDEILKFKLMGEGFMADHLLYGGGLMVSNVDPTVNDWECLNETATYYGHGGHTYGYISGQGFFPKLNISMSIITN